MSWHKGKKELTEDSTGDGKHSRKKRERLFKKRFSRLILFSGSPKNKFPQGRSQLAEEPRRCLPRKGWRQQAAREEPCSLRQLGALQLSGKMCPGCEIRLCRPCGTLHSQRGFIAHSLLDHYDPAALPC
ncbi:hypothetical protein TURU_084570 [Turdus rufiventris]|nr:hypothetical protein TURU_084570 [Turdus rufiventris]